MNYIALILLLTKINHTLQHLVLAMKCLFVMDVLKKDLCSHVSNHGDIQLTKSCCNITNTLYGLMREGYIKLKARVLLGRA